MASTKEGSSIFYCLTQGTNNGDSLEGKYRPATVTTTTTGYSGTVVSGLVFPDPGDLGADTSFVNVPFAAPTVNGSLSAHTMPTGNPGTWCTIK